MPYRIKDRQREAAKRIGVTIRPSSDPSKKIDVYKDGFFVARIGAAGYDDYASILQKEYKARLPPGEAQKRSQLYAVRHAQDRINKGTPGYYAYEILWT